MPTRGVHTCFIDGAWPGVDKGEAPHCVRLSRDLREEGRQLQRRGRRGRGLGVQVMLLRAGQECLGLSSPEQQLWLGLLSMASRCWCSFEGYVKHVGPKWLKILLLWSFFFLKHWMCKNLSLFWRAFELTGLSLLGGKEQARSPPTGRSSAPSWSEGPGATSSSLITTLSSHF